MGGDREAGSAPVEFALVASVAVVVFVAVMQLALFLYERNVVMGSLAEGVRVAAVEGRSVADGRRAATELLRAAAGERVARALAVTGAEERGVVVLRVDGALPSVVPGVPGMRLRMVARMREERL